MRISPNYIASLVTGGAAALCIFAVLYSGGQSSESVSAKLQVADAARQSEDSGGRLGELAPEFDMGTISNSETTEKTLSIVNTGNGPLEIKDVQTSCGCTKAQFKNRYGKPIKSLKIPAGESAELYISVDPFKVPGFESRKVCTLFTNDPANKAAQFDVTAKVNPEFEIEPKQLHLGVLNKGDTASGTAILRQLAADNLDVNAVRAGARSSETYTVALSPRPESEWRTPGKREWNIDVELDSASLNKGLFRDRVYVESNIERLNRTYAYMINAEVQTFYSVIPEMLHRRDAVEAGATGVASAAVTSEQPIVIEGLTCSDPDLVASVNQADSPTSAVIELGVAENASPGVKNATLEFAVVGDDGSRAEHSIRAIVAVK